MRSGWEVWSFAEHRFEVDTANPIGRGGFGTVYPAWSEGIGDVAVKAMPVEDGPVVQREVGNAERLIGLDLEHVVEVFAVGMHLDQAVIVMERGETSLRRQLGIRLDALEAVGVLDQVGAGLAALHGVSIVHRDLKPENVIKVGGVWKLCDFGLGRLLDHSTATHTFRGGGTPAYMAPEQWRAEASTKATDVYALGCLAFELFTGVRPFEAPDQQELGRLHLTETPPELPETVPVHVRTLILEMLRKGQGERPPDAKAVLERFRQDQDGAKQSSPLAKVAQREVRKQSADEALEAKRQAAAQREGDIQQTAKVEIVEIFDQLESWARKDLRNVERSAGETISADGFILTHFSVPPPYGRIGHDQVGDVAQAGYVSLTINDTSIGAAANTVFACEVEGSYRWSLCLLEPYGPPSLEYDPEELPLTEGEFGVDVGLWHREIQRGRGIADFDESYYKYSVSREPLTTRSMQALVERYLESDD